MWGEIAGDNYKQVIREGERCELRFFFCIWPDGLAEEPLEWSFELLREPEGLHITARPYVAKAHAPITRSPSLCATSFSWSRHAH